MSTKTGDVPHIQKLDDVVIRFAGDSGDGMQLTGSQFSNVAALAGNDVATLPDFPAEIRAPAGSLAGVSAFQIHFSSFEIHTPGGRPDVLVAMNPAALKANLGDLKESGILIVNESAFSDRNLQKAGYEENPLETGALGSYRVISVPITDLTRKALAETSLTAKEKDRSKNLFALGIMYWLYNRDHTPTLQWLKKKFRGKDALIEANALALKGGLSYAAATEVFQSTYEVPPAKLPAGTYRGINGNAALAMGLIAAAHQAEIRIFQGSYPITPASDILHELSRYKHFGVITFQAEDEIAAVSSAIGASYAGLLGVTSTSGPGMALKGEAMGLAVMTELPLVIIDVQRAGPSTGLPTKPEQGDLLMALFGRPSECPMPVLAPATPGDCFWIAFEAARIALKHMTPVIVLSDGYLGNGTEPFRIPEVSELPQFKARYAQAAQSGAEFMPYARDPKTLARPWALPGTPGLEHRIGGLEKTDGSGTVDYDPGNHEHMIKTRAEKVERVCLDIPPTEVFGPESGDVLVLGWGGTYGAIRGAVEGAQEAGKSVAHVHIRHLNPLPSDLGDILTQFKQVLIPELNLGQLNLLVRARYLVDAQGFNKVEGRTFSVEEMSEKINEILESSDGSN